MKNRSPVEPALSSGLPARAATVLAAKPVPLLSRSQDSVPVLVL